MKVVEQFAQFGILEHGLGGTVEFREVATVLMFVDRGLHGHFQAIDLANEARLLTCLRLVASQSAI